MVAHCMWCVTYISSSERFWLPRTSYSSNELIQQLPRIYSVSAIVLRHKKKLKNEKYMQFLADIMDEKGVLQKWEVAIVSSITWWIYPCIRWLWTLWLAPKFKNEGGTIIVQWLSCQRKPILISQECTLMSKHAKKLPEISMLLCLCEKTGFKESNCNLVFYFKIRQWIWK